MRKRVDVRNSNKCEPRIVLPINSPFSSGRHQIIIMVIGHCVVLCVSCGECMKCVGV